MFGFFSNKLEGKFHLLRILFDFIYINNNPLYHSQETLKRKCLISLKLNYS